MSIQDEMYAELKRQWERRAFIAEVERDIALLGMTEGENDND